MTDRQGLNDEYMCGYRAASRMLDSLIEVERAAARRESLDVERLLRVIDSIEAVAHGQGAMAAAEWGLGDRDESYVTNPASRNLLKGLVREARAALSSIPEGGPAE